MARESSSSPQRILERAIEVLDEHGEAGIRTHQIAEECGVTAPILYRAFGDREGLIIAAQAERYRRSRLYLADELVKGVLDAATVEDFREVLTLGMTAMFTEGRWAARRLRHSVLGSAMTRPELERAVVEALDSTYDSFVPALEYARRRGWVVYEGDLRTFLAFWAGVLDGRITVEMEGADMVESDWNALALDAILGPLLGRGD